MNANTCCRCWKDCPKARPFMPTKAMTVRKTGNIWKSIGCWTALCAKPTATVRCRKCKPNVTDICRRPVMWLNKALVRCTVNSAMPGQPISGWVKWAHKAIWRRCVWTYWKPPTGALSLRPLAYLQNKNGSLKATVFCFKPYTGLSVLSASTDSVFWTSFCSTGSAASATGASGSSTLSSRTLWL